MEFIGFIIWIVMIAVCIWPYVIIAKRAGVTPWFALTQLIPIVNIIALWYLALTTWRIDQNDRKEYQIISKKDVD